MSDSLDTRKIREDALRRMAQGMVSPYARHSDLNGLCSVPGPFADGMGHPATGTAGKGGFNLADFGKELPTGFVMGGLSSAAFYGAGKAVEAVKGSVRNVYRNRKINDFRDLMTLDERERYDNYWKQGVGSFKNKKMPDGNVQEVVIGSGDTINTRQRLQTKPGTRSIVDVKYGNSGDMYYRETVFDEFGRKIGINDFTNHHRPDIPAHTNPHYHANLPTMPSQHGRPVPGLHPDTPRK